MFFEIVFPFKVILDIFDHQVCLIQYAYLLIRLCFLFLRTTDLKQNEIHFFSLIKDGLRRLYNSLSTLKIHYGPDDDNIDDDGLFIQRQIIKSALNALKQYTETHLAIRCEKEMNAVVERDGYSPEPPKPNWIPYKLDQNQVTEQIDTLMGLMNYRSRWKPIDEFVKLGGISLLLKMIVKSYDWILVGKEDTVKPALDVLAVCSILPRVQLSLCENRDPPDDKNGIYILIACAEGEVVNFPSVQKAALLVLAHLLCAPINRPGSIKHGSERTPAKRRSSEEIINAVWECFRSNNGIMAMLQLVQGKTPVSDADKIRTLACQVLVGLARSTTATQIMSKLPIFNNGVLTMLVREPVLPDNLADHLKFQKYAQDLLEKVSGPGSQRTFDNHDITLDMLHRASVVANTKIRYNNKQLCQLIHEHLVLSGLKKTADVLCREADLVPLVQDNCPSIFPATGMISSLTPLPHRRTLLSPPTRTITPRQLIMPSSRPSIQSRVQSSSAQPQRSLDLSSSRQPASSSLSIRINRTPRTCTTVPVTSRLGPKPSEPMLNGRVSIDPVEQERKVTLTSLVSDYLSNKHAFCKNPMTTCPEFDLFLPHKCPDKRSKREAPVNLATRQSWKKQLPPFGGPGGAKLDRKLVYSKFRPVKVFRAAGDEMDGYIFACCAFSGDGQFLLAGTSTGEIKMYNISSGGFLFMVSSYILEKTQTRLAT